MSDKKQGHDFEVGQKVRCIDAANVHRLGAIYTVVDLRPGDVLSLLECDGLWSATRFEPVEEGQGLDDLKAAFAEHWPELQAYPSETKKELPLREERDHWKAQVEIARAMLAKQDEKIERQLHTIRVRTEDVLDLKKQLDGQKTLIRILREQQNALAELLNDLLK